MKLIDNGRNVHEQIFVKAQKINNNKIEGTIASKLNRFPNRKMGDPISVKNTEVLDWTITKPNGKEEGNLVGKFMDVLIDRYLAIIIEIDTDKTGKVTSAKFLRLPIDTNKMFLIVSQRK